MWGRVIDRLGPGYRVFVPRVWKAATMEESAGYVAEAVRREGGGRALIAGLSMGGYVVFETLRRYPELIEGAALLDTTAYPDDEHRREKRKQVLRLLAEGKFEEVKEVFVHSILWAEGPHREAEAEFLLRMCTDLGPEAYARSLTAIMERGGYEDVLENCPTPMLFLSGAHDTLSPPDLAAKMAATAKNAQAYEIPDAAHMTAVENPDAVAYALGEFFSRFSGKALA
jgi:pimeloyl-ACP methyl ester carboxylesterase